MSNPNADRRRPEGQWRVSDWNVTLRRYAPGTEMPPHGHDFHGVSVVLAGSLLEDVRHLRACASAGSVVIKPKATIHANRFGPTGATLLSLTSPDWGASADISRNPQWSWNRSIDTVGSAICFLDALDSAGLRESNEEHIAEQLLDFVAVAFGSSALGHTSAPSWLAEVRAYIDFAPGEVRVTALAASVGVHPVYLARRFRQAYGCSISTYRRRARVLASLAAIADPQQTLADVAAREGFADQSHLAREYRAAFGTTPTRLRTLIA